MDQIIHERAGGIAARSFARHLPLAALAIGIVLLVALFFREGRAAVEVWDASTAYGHCYLILPMSLYLLWDRRDRVPHEPARRELVWIVLTLPIAALWLTAERLGIMEGRQLAAIAGLEVLFLVVLGRRLFQSVSGPLLYLFFLVPFGAFLTPALQHFTARFSVIGLDLLGIPNFSDNFIMETPAGIFFVAEACAGLRFLIAAVAFGVFYALLNFRSPWRKLAFVLAAIAVPIVANGFRALGIVVLGQILGSAEAAVADHLIYGWVFFSIVMLLLVAAGHPFRETGPAPTFPTAASRSPSTSRLPVGAVIATVALLALGPAIAALIDARAAPMRLAAMPALTPPSGCEPVIPRDSADPARREATLRCGPIQFDIALTVFPARSTATALVATRRQITQEIGAEDVAIAPMSGSGGRWLMIQTTDPNRLTATASWVDGEPVRGGLAGRVAQAKDSLLGADYAPVLITITTPEPARASVDARRAKLDLMRAIVAAQPDLDADIARLSKLSPTG